MNRLRGFTLIELLVVMSIISVLVAILLPVLSKARRQAKLVLCASNQRQVLTSYMVYTVDHKDHIPRPLIGGGYFPTPFMQWHSGQERLNPVGIGVLFARGYINGGRVGTCPDHPGSESGQVAANLDELAAHGRYLSVPSGGWTYLFRAPAQGDTQYNNAWRNLPGNAHEVTNQWPNWVRRWNSYAQAVATKIDGNLPGGEIRIEANPSRRVIRSPLSLMICRVRTNNTSTTRWVHGDDKAFNAAFPDGTVFQVDYSVRTTSPPRISDVFFNFADRTRPSWVYVQKNRDDEWR